MNCPTPDVGGQPASSNVVRAGIVQLQLDNVRGDRHPVLVRRVGLRLPDRLWKSVSWYGQAAGLIRTDGRLDISEAVRDLISRGLVSADRSAEAGYRSGYREGRLAAYAEVMERLAGGGTLR